MGIGGLLPLLKPVTRDRHISHYAGKRLAVDGYAWLHRASYGCCLQLAMGEVTTAWIVYILSMIDMLLAFDITVHMVFDGDELPAKKVTEEGRAASRAANMTAGLEAMNKGDHVNARVFFSKAVDITPRMAAEVIKVLREKRPVVRVVVAPFEADAQLSYLCRTDQVDGVIAEDSDTIPYGCKEAR